MGSGKNLRWEMGFISFLYSHSVTGSNLEHVTEIISRNLLRSEILTFLPLTVLPLTLRQRSCWYSDVEADLWNCQNQETRLIDEERTKECLDCEQLFSSKIRGKNVEQVLVSESDWLWRVIFEEKWRDKIYYVQYPTSCFSYKSFDAKSVY